MFYYTNSTLKTDVWGSYSIPNGTKSFIVTGYVTDGGVAVASDKIILYCTVQPDGETSTQDWTLVVSPGDSIAITQEGIGTITALKDPGTRVRILLINN